MNFNSDNATSVYKPVPCGKYRIKVLEIPELRSNQKGTRCIRFGKMSIVGQDRHVQDDVFITEGSAWRVERMLRCLVGSVTIDEEKLCSEEYRRSLVGREGDADIGILKYRNKQGQVRYVNEVANYISDKNPSIGLSPDLECTTDKTLQTAPTGTAGATPVAGTTGGDLPAASDHEEAIGDDDVPF